MTVPYISVPAWDARRTGVFGLQGRASWRRPPRVATLPPSVATARRFRPAWIDLAIQLVVGGAIIALMYAAVTMGVFTRAVDGFTDWYIGDVVPLYGAGTAAVVVTEPYEAGFFQARPEPPAGLTYESVRFATRPGSGGLP